MKVVVVGTGGREAAIAWACEREGHDVTITAELGDHVSADGTALVIPGPEAALVDGIADRCAALGVPCFGPTAALARLESSKGFTRALAAQLGLPSPAYVRTESVDEALAWWHELGRPVVVKLDGLAAGKGVIVPTNPAATEAAIIELARRGPIVVEERLHGPECSLMALCDGRVARPLPLAQDHKRIGEGDSGPNTGGMGAYAPAPVPYSVDELCARFVQPVLDHLAAAGTPYVGVLYAGLMLTPSARVCSSSTAASVTRRPRRSSRCSTATWPTSPWRAARAGWDRSRSSSLPGRRAPWSLLRAATRRHCGSARRSSVSPTSCPATPTSHWPSSSPQARTASG